jgi:hypothetical protein
MIEVSGLPSGDPRLDLGRVFVVAASASKERA